MFYNAVLLKRGFMLIRENPMSNPCHLRKNTEGVLQFLKFKFRRSFRSATVVKINEPHFE